MTANLRRVALMLCLALPAWRAHADPEGDRIAAERAAANAKFTEQERACRQRFVAAPCLDAARKQQHATLARLRQQGLARDEARRTEAATARRRELSEKAAAQQARASEAAAAPRAHRAHEPSKPNAALGTRTPDAEAKPRASGTDEERRARETHNEQEFEARARAAQAHREAVERRNAQRAAQGKVAAPLPVPDAASAP